MRIFHRVCLTTNDEDKSITVAAVIVEKVGAAFAMAGCG
jgi:hypothetical protein